MIDTAPFNMYTKAGYSVVQTDTIIILLMLQRRKHLMRKKLPAMTMGSSSESDVPNSLEEWSCEWYRKLAAVSAEVDNIMGLLFPCHFY